MEINRDNLLSLIQSGIKREAMSISGLEKQASVPKDTVRDFLRGKTQILRADKLQKILRILEPQHKVRVSGHLVAGAEIISSDVKDDVDCPTGCDPSDVIAVRVKGDGMLPVFYDGWVIYYSRRHDIHIPAISGGWQVPYGKPDAKGVKDTGERFAEFIGKPSIVGLLDGRIMLGILKPSAGSQNRYDLINHNMTDIKNITPQWAAKIIFIKTE